MKSNPKNRWNSVSELWSTIANTSEFTFVLADNKIYGNYPRLTPSYLATVITPYLNVIVAVQKVIDDAKGLKHSETAISLISQKSPISVSLDGASEAIGLIQETVIPWRRKHAETMSRLSEQEKLAEIELKKAEILEKRAIAEKERMEATKQREEAEQLRLENERLKLELQRAKVQLVVELLIQVAPNLSEVDKIAYIVQLLPSLDVIIFSELEISKK